MHILLDFQTLFLLHSVRDQDRYHIHSHAQKMRKRGKQSEKTLSDRGHCDPRLQGSKRKKPGSWKGATESEAQGSVTAEVPDRARLANACVLNFENWLHIHLLLSWIQNKRIAFICIQIPPHPKGRGD